jgi:type IX secretion system PorP/SprF family membrane protein
MKKTMKKLILMSILLMIGFQSFSQQDPQYSLYMFNPMGVNPGYAGSREVLSAVLVHRSQWIGLEGAPETQTLAINSPLKNKKMGVGLQIVNDNIGPRTIQSLTATYAYRLKLGAGKLAFGLRGGILNYHYDWEKIEYKEQDDIIPTTADESFILPTFDFGIYYNSKTFYIGLAADHLNGAKFKLIESDTAVSNARVYSNFTATFGKAFFLNDNLVLKTSVLMRATQTAGNIDINASILIKNSIMFGVSARPNALVLLTEINLTDNLRMGAAYDLDGSDLTHYHSGSFEIFLGYDVGLFKSKVMSPRYF